MTVKDVIKNIKIFLSVNTALAAFKTSEGLIFETDELIVGALVVEVTEDGKNPVVAGVYTLEDGTILTIVEGGVIEKIEIPEETATPVEPMMSKDEPVKPVDLSEQFITLKAEFEALKLEQVEILKTLQILSQSLSDKLFKTELKTELKKIPKKVEKV